MHFYPVLNIQQFDFVEKRGDFYANKFKTHYKLHHSSIDHAHKHDFYLVVLFTQGSGVHEVDFQSYPIEPGSLFVMRPGQMHHWELSDDIDGFVFFHTGTFYEVLYPGKRIDDYPIFYSNQSAPFVQLTLDELADFERRFERIYNEYIGNEPMKYRKLGHEVDLVYIDVHRKLWAKEQLEVVSQSVDHVRLKQLEELIEAQYKNWKKPAEYAQALSISVNHLNRLVHEAFEKSTSQLIHERILLEAKRLLILERTNVQDVAYELGFEDASYFARFFKRKVGETPSAFIHRYS